MVINGNTTIMVLAGLGTITVTATKSNYDSGTLTITSSQPATLSITANPGSVVVNTPTYVTFTVTSNSQPVSGALVGVTGAGTGTGTTDINGQVTILINAALGTLTATASKTGYSGTTTLTSTTPITLAITASPSNVTVNNPTYVIFTVTGNGQPVSGAIVDITGAATGSGTTDINGQVTLLVNPALGTVTATASKTGYISGTTTLTTTAPITLTIIANPSNVTVNNPTYVTFTVRSDGQPVSGAIVDISGAATGSGTTNINGQVTILINAALGTATATASKTGYISGTTTITALRPPTLEITASNESVPVRIPRYVTFTVTRDNQPVSGAIVSLTGAATGRGTTNINGQITILIIPAYGVITATASKAGFISGTTTISTGEGPMLQIEANPSNLTANTPTFVTFTVSANGNPVSNAIVFLTDAASGMGTTDSSGRVRILVNAAFGTITATASKTGYSSDTITIPVQETPGVIITPGPTPEVTVTPGPTPITPTSTGEVTRNMPSGVQANSQFTVTIVPSPENVFDSPGYQVTETLPQGFVYVDTTAMGANVRNNSITFTQLGSSSITYNVMAPPTNGTYTFSGIFRDELNNVGNVLGRQTITVGAVTGLRYDANNNGRIDRSEAVQAVMDYFNGDITRQDAIDVVMAYFSG